MRRPKDMKDFGDCEGVVEEQQRVFFLEQL